MVPVALAYQAVISFYLWNINAEASLPFPKAIQFSASLSISHTDGTPVCSAAVDIFGTAVCFPKLNREPQLVHSLHQTYLNKYHDFMFVSRDQIADYSCHHTSIIIRTYLSHRFVFSREATSGLLFAHSPYKVFSSHQLLCHFVVRISDFFIFHIH